MSVSELNSWPHVEYFSEYLIYVNEFLWILISVHNKIMYEQNSYN